MIGRLGAAALVALACCWPRPASPEVVELVGGEWVDGTLREATPAGVVVEVGGQIIRFPTDKVRAIYFGGPPAAPPSRPAAAPPPPPEPAVAQTPLPAAQFPAPLPVQPAAAPEPARTSSPASDALQVMKSLRAALLHGMSFSEYQARVASAVNVVDRHLAAMASGPESDAIGDVARYYALAAAAWNNQGASSRTVWLRKDDALGRCAAYQDFARAMRDKGEAYYAERVKNYVVISDGVVSVLWSCAAEKITEAETLLVKEPKTP